MKKILIAIMLILTTMLTTTNVIYASSISQGETTIYTTNELPDVISWDDIESAYVYYDVEKTFAEGIFYNSLEIDADGPFYDISNDSWYEIINGYNEYSIYPVRANKVRMVWNDMYIFVNEFNVYMEASVNYTADIEIIYYNSTGDTNNTYKYTDSNYLLSSSMFDGIYSNNGIAHINTIIVDIETGSETDQIGNLYFELDEIQNYDNYNSDIQFMAKEFMPTTELNIGAWLLDSISAFMSFELLPGFSLLTLFSLIVAIPLLLWILKMFIGG